MGTGGIQLENERKQLKILLEKYIIKFETIVEYFKIKNEIQQEHNFIQQFIIILLILREMEILKNLIANGGGHIKLPQFNFKLKKVYNMKFKGIDLKSPFFLSIKAKLETLIKNLKQLAYKNKKIEDSDIIESFNINLSIPFGGKKLFSIIEIYYRAKIQNNFLKYMNKELFILNKNYTKEYLIKLYMIKYITQYIIFIKELINHTINLNAKNNNTNILNKEEIKICKVHCFDESKIMTFLLFEELSYCNHENIKNRPFLIKENDEVELEDLIKLYLEVLKIINECQIELEKRSNDINK